MKVYKSSKRGALSMVEKRLSGELQKAVNDLIENDPSVEHRFKPATNYQELKELHNRYCTEETVYTDIEDEDGDEDPFNEDDAVEDSPKSSSSKSENGYMPDGFDPLNAESPIERDYVLEEGLKEEYKAPSRSFFGEPTNFEDSFEIPASREESPKNDKDKSTKNTTSEKSKSKEPANPLNPSFVDMEKSDRSKSTKQLAKYIVDITCGLFEFGFVWYATKDITDEKLIEYETKTGLNLQLLITLENNQQSPIVDWFRSVRIDVAKVAKFDKEERAELAAALYPVLMEKGVALSPTQHCLMVFGGALVQKGVEIFKLKSQVKGVLDQLVAMKKTSDDNESEKEDFISQNHQREQREREAATAPVYQNTIKEPHAPFDMNETKTTSDIVSYEEI